jgi:uncharacterized protein (UPF0333 family)
VNAIKGSISSEFLVVFGLMLLIGLVFYSFQVGESINIQQIREKLAAHRNALAASTALNYVYLAGDGAQYNFTLPYLIDGENITIYEGSVESRKGGALSSAPLLSSNTNSTTMKGGRTILRNNRGVIEIEQ